MSELQHHGILGMKWGVRRYQNKDGTLTEAGKKRQLETEYGRLEDQMTYGKKADAKKNAKLSKQMRSLEKQMQKPKTQRPSHDDYVRAHEKKRVEEMSDKELRERLNRLDMEQRYKKIPSEQVSKGKDVVQTVIKTGATVATVTSTALTIYNNWQKIQDIIKKTGG